MSLCKAERFHKIATSRLRKYSPAGYWVGNRWPIASNLMEWSCALRVCWAPRRTILGLFRKFFSGWPTERIIIAELEESWKKRCLELNVYGCTHLEQMTRAAAEIENETGFRIVVTLEADQEKFESWLSSPY